MEARRWCSRLPSTQESRSATVRLNSALARLGYRGVATAHGFRTLFSTCANEAGWNSDVIEKQLSHEERDDVRGAYNRAQWLAERTELMQWWANHLQTFRPGPNSSRGSKTKGPRSRGARAGSGVRKDFTGPTGTAFAGTGSGEPRDVTTVNTRRPCGSDRGTSRVSSRIRSSCGSRAALAQRRSPL